MKSGFIGIIGRPNVGKSTLLNAILGEKISITTDKPQTTRNSIRGIYTRDGGEETGCQMIFIDTPGIHKPRNKLGSYMTDMAVRTLKEVDVIVFIVDDICGPGDMHILEMLKQTATPSILAINKIDKLPPDRFRSIYEEYDAMGIFHSILGISALEGKNLRPLIETVESLLKEGPMYFPEDIVTDHPAKFLVSEIIREKTLLYLEEEVPHGIAVEIEGYQEKEDVTVIGAVIYCEKKSHKGIIIGKGGKKLKGISKGARMEIEGLLGTRVYLEIWVKVRENWRDSSFSISEFGYRKE
ncbi:MAG TPA: GTPase Era [Bacillota bacterium]|jgi:GTP-binding protein Era|nr:GTPase Era [Bacillota bacterium]